MVKLKRLFQFNLCAVLLALSLSACQSAPARTRLAVLPQDPNIEVYTNQNPAAQFVEPYRQIQRPGDNLEHVLIEAIKRAKSSIEIAVQEFRLPNVAQALRDRARSGVKVRVILENTYARPFSAYTPDEVAKLPDREKDRYQEARKLIDQNNDGALSPTEISERDALVILDNAKIPRIDDTIDHSRGSSLMHHKFMVIDHQTVIVSSANLTTSDLFGDAARPSSRGNANNLLKINSPELAALFVEEFDLMWKNHQFGVKKPYRSTRLVKVGDTTIEVQFSPSAANIKWQQTTNGLIAKTLSQATRSIDLALFVFSDQDLVNSIEPQHDRGVDIRALIEPSFMYRSYSEGLDMLGVGLSDHCKFEPNNHPWRNPLQTVGVPQLPPGDMLHHKFGIVDQTTVITGSHNWTNAADRGNDETLLVIHSPIVAAHFDREFDRLYANATIGIPPAIERKINAQQKQCPQAPLAQSPKIVNLNTATQAELEALPGVGAGLAKRIIAARQQKPFASLEDLDRVPGVGTKLLEKLRDRITW